MDLAKPIFSMIFLKIDRSLSIESFYCRGPWSGRTRLLAGPYVPRHLRSRPPNGATRQRDASGLNRQRLNSQQTLEISDGLCEPLPQHCGRGPCEQFVSLANVGASSPGVVDR